MHAGDSKFFDEGDRQCAEVMRSPEFEPFGTAGGASRQLFRSIIEPSFDDWQTIQLLQHLEWNGSGEAYMLTHRRWNRTASARRSDPSSIVTSHHSIDPATAKDWAEMIHRISVPVRRSSCAGLDGTTYELQVRAGAEAMAVRWWGDGPPEWRIWTTQCRWVLDQISKLQYWVVGPIGPSGRVRLVLRFRSADPTIAELYAVRKLHWRWCDQMPDAIAAQASNGELVICDTDYDRSFEVRRRADALALNVETRYLT